MTESPRPLDVLIVASWFPSVDDGTAGRFVADQAEALLARDDVRPSVASFDPARLTGGATARDLQASAVGAIAGRAIAGADPLFVPGAVGVDPGLPVTRLPIPEGLTRSAGAAHQARHRADALMAMAQRLAADGGSGAPDVVHAHTGYPDGAAAVRVADRFGCPLVITEHASFVERILGAPDLAAEYRAAVARAARILAVSEMLAGELRAAFPDFAERIVVLPNAVAIDDFRAPPLSNRRADELLFVGYRKASKGIETLLRGFAVARASRPSATLRLIGGSPDDAAEAGWHALAASLGIADAVRFDPPATRAEVAAAMAEASLFVHASPRETFGMVAAEALAAGLPVVATDSGGVTEVVGAGTGALGQVVERESPDALGAGIVATLDRRESFDPARLRASVTERFAAARVAERLAAIYGEVLADAPGGGPRRTTTRTTTPRTAAAAEKPSGAVLVALDAERARARLAGWPEFARRRVVLVTASDGAVPIDESLAGEVIRVAVAAMDAPARSTRGGLAGRLERLSKDPLGTIARRLGRGPGSRAAVGPATRAVEDALRRDPSLALVAVDGPDHLAIEPIVAAGRAAPFAGLRRLADAWLPESAAEPHAPGGG